MTNKRIIAALSLLLALFLIILIIKNRFLKRSSDVSPNIKSASVYIEQKKITVEVADTEPAREKGLSGRSRIENDHGMLFVFDKKDVLPIFWMKEMLIPIDIIWINDGKITGIDPKVPPPASVSSPDSELIKYPSPGITDYVLEVESGFSQSNNIKTGDQVKIEF